MASRRQATVGVFWSTVERAATQGISFIVVLVLARLLGPTNYGLVTLAATIALLGQTLLGETFSEALIQRSTIEPAHASTIFWLLAAVGIVACGVVWASADLLAVSFGEPALPAIMRALSFLLPLAALQAVPTALFRRSLDFRAIAAASASGTLLGGVAGIGLGVAGYGAWSLVANLLVQNAVVTVGLWKQTSFRPERLFSRRHLAELWSYGQYTFLLRIAAFTANQSPRLLVGYLFGPAALGAFGLAQRITDIGYQLFVMPAANVTVPMIARVREDPQRLQGAILRATQLVAMITMPVFVGLALVAPYAVPLIFGHRWLESIPIVQIMAISGIFGSASLLYRSIVGGLGRPAVNLASAIGAAVSSLAVLVAAAPWGLLATSAVFVIRGCIFLPLQPLLVTRLTKISLWKQYQVFLPIIAATTLMAIAVEIIIVLIGPDASVVRITLATAAAGAGTYALCLYFFAEPVVDLCAVLIADLRARSKLG